MQTEKYLQAGFPLEGISLNDEDRIKIKMIENILYKKVNNLLVDRYLLKSV